jgi:hypothetical protein
MPSEVVYGSGGDVDIRVSWGNGESELVQVATLAVNHGLPGEPDPTERMLGIVNEWLTGAGMSPIDVAELRRRSPAPIMFDGWHATLGSWGQANRLIKVLQRARDRAYGSPA